MEINKKDHNWYGFNAEKVCKQFEGDLTYLNTFCIKPHYHPFAVFRNASPNRSKDHKDFLLLFMARESVMVTGMDADKIEDHRYQTGMYCPDCREVIYSVNRHDYRKCKCGRCMVDGGKDYFRSNMAGTTVKIDFLLDDITALKEDYCEPRS